MYLALVRTDIKTAIDHTQTERFAINRSSPNGPTTIRLECGYFILSPKEKNIAGHNHRMRIFTRNRP